MEYKHIPVMMEEVLEYLNPQPNQNFIDCTLGGGGYTKRIAEKILPFGKILALDLDDMALDNFRFQISDLGLNNIILANENFENLSKIIKDLTPSLSLSSRRSKENKETKFNGIVFDLGLSSAQLADRHRGFSFQLDAPLDMTFGGKSKKTEYIINKYKQEELEKIIRDYGEERFARRIAKSIVKERKIAPIKTTKNLVDIIKKSIPKKFQLTNHRHGGKGGASKIHFATRTFQAIRIATNDELNSLEKALPQAIDLLKKKGRVAVVSYHSLEDRIVKNYFKKENKDCLCPSEIPICQCGHKAKIKILTKKPIIPSLKELEKNPRARSAKLRVAEKK